MWFIRKGSWHLERVLQGVSPLNIVDILGIELGHVRPKGRLNGVSGNGVIGVVGGKRGLWYLVEEEKVKA